MKKIYCLAQETSKGFRNSWEGGLLPTHHPNLVRNMDVADWSPSPWGQEEGRLEGDTKLGT